MINQYDFLNLSYVEFEELCRDLLQKQLGVTMESFADGADGGIDLRFLHTTHKALIIQCKRYSSFTHLSKALKNEVLKLASIDVQEYKVATSVSLTVEQKNKLVNIVHPYLKSPADIYGRKDLNALLREYPEIESRHFKLWLQSTAVLETIFRSKVINQSHFKMQDIRDLLKKYVVNPSFAEAEKILEKNRFVVISGIPGIGKSTLAYVLAYAYLARKDYAEFIYISESIDEAYEQFREGKRQIFLFDDFLGQSFQDRTLSRNEDRRIIDFIRQVHKSKDKILLFTTREYILREVQLKHELLSEPDIEFAKCLIDLSTYTKLIKAKILYNHLVFSDLSASHLKAFAVKKNYQPIINHKNYSPRIIETAIRQELADPLTPSAFVKKIIASLDNPYKIWEKPFTDQITETSRILLTIVFTMGTPVTLDDAREACASFFTYHKHQYPKAFTTAVFHKAIKELENSFLISQKDRHNVHVLRFQNPSIRDFLLNYYQNNLDQLYPVIEAAIFQEQFFIMLRPAELDASDKNSRYMAKKIVCDEKLNQLIVSKIMSDGEKLGSADINVLRTSYPTQEYYQHSGNGQYILLQTFQTTYRDTGFYPAIYRYVLSRMQSLSELPKDSNPNSNELVSYASLLKLCKADLTLDPALVLASVSDKLFDLHEYAHYFTDFKTVFPIQYEDFIQSDDFAQKLYDLTSDEMDNVQSDNTEDLSKTLEDIARYYTLNFDEELEKLRRMQTGPDHYPEEDDDRFEYEQEKRNEEKQIDGMFSSLKDAI